MRRARRLEASAGSTVVKVTISAPPDYVAPTDSSITNLTAIAAAVNAVSETALGEALGVAVSVVAAPAVAVANVTRTVTKTIVATKQWCLLSDQSPEPSSSHQSS